MAFIWTNKKFIIKLCQKYVTLAKSSNAAYSELSLQDFKTDEDLQMAIAEIEALQHHTDMIQVAAAIEINTCET